MDASLRSPIRYEFQQRPLLANPRLQIIPRLLQQAHRPGPPPHRPQRQKHRIIIPKVNAPPPPLLLPQKPLHRLLPGPKLHRPFHPHHAIHLVVGLLAPVPNDREHHPHGLLHEYDWGDLRSEDTDGVYQAAFAEDRQEV